MSSGYFWWSPLSTAVATAVICPMYFLTPYPAYCSNSCIFISFPLLLISFVLHLISIVASLSAMPGQPHLTLHTRGSNTVKGGTDLPFLLSHIFPLPHIFLNQSAPPQAAIKQFNSDGINSLYLTGLTRLSICQQLS